MTEISPNSKYGSQLSFGDTTEVNLFLVLGYGTEHIVFAGTCKVKGILKHRAFKFLLRMEDNQPQLMTSQDALKMFERYNHQYLFLHSNQIEHQSQQSFSRSLGRRHLALLVARRNTSKLSQVY